MSDTSTQRIIPGAPPPPPVTKSQLKKKRKAKSKATEQTGESPVEIPDATAAALVEKAPEPSEIQDGVVAPELVVQPPTQPTSEDGTLKLSPIVDLVNKRLKATNKKITRISSYIAADPKTLNEDQKRSISSLSALEAVSKELLEVKKAVEAHETELAGEIASNQRALVEAQNQRVSEAVSATQAADVKKTVQLLSFIRMKSLLESGGLDLHALGSSQEEIQAIHAAGAVIFGSESEAQEFIRGFLSGEGQFGGVPYSRFPEICNHIFSPPPVQEAVVEPPPQEPVPEEQEEETPTTPANVTMTTSGSFHFMQASELEPHNATPLEENTEWVPVEAADAVETSEHVPEANGHVVEAASEIPAPADPIDWAAEDEGELPPIDNLHATFGKSGSATPIVEPENPEPVDALVNGEPATEDDGFTQARGGRGRGFRGTRGGFRGAPGGDRDFRGGDRGFRGGGYRGRGGGRGRGEWRGGDGEHRGRGRGRGRGGFAPPA